MVPPKSPYHSFVHIKDILERELKKYRFDEDEDLCRIWEMWYDLLDSPFNEYSRPNALHQGILLVDVASSVVIHQMTFMKAELIQNINSIMNKPLIKDMKFRVAAL